MISDTTPKTPDWAWAPYVPDAKRPWDLRRAAHLYRRAAFGATWGQVQQALHDGPARTIDRLLRPEADVAEFQRAFDEYEQEAIDPGAESADVLCEWWLRRMIQTPYPLLEKMTLFWHGHFAVRNFEVKNGRLMARYVGQLRRHALGRFEPLLCAVVADPAVRLSFNASANRKRALDLTLSRALLERFTLGPGAATERDVHEAARVITGLVVLRNESRFLPGDHDGGEKTILGSSGNWSEADLVRLAVASPTTARSLARLVYRWFVSEADEPADALLAPLAEVIRQGGRVSQQVETVLRSNLFFSEAAYRQRIKSPLEFALGLTVALEGLVPTSHLSSDLAELGQNLAEPPTSCGWQGGKAWISPATLLGRSNLAALMLSPEGPYAARLDPHQTALAHGKNSTAEAEGWLIDLLVQGDIPAPVLKVLRESAATGKGDGLRRLTHQVVTLPEFQLA
jgi:uncharacterized protein (DUF1800 family)